LFGGDALTGIGYLQNNAVVFFMTGDGDAAAVRHGLLSVNEQVNQYLPDLHGINLNRRQIFGQFVFQGNVGKGRPMINRFQGLSDNLLDVYCLKMGFGRMGVRHQVSDDF